MSSRLTKKSLVSVPGAEVRTPSGDCPGVRAQHPQAAHQDGHLRRGQVQQVRPVDQQVLRRQPVALAAVVAEPVGGRLERGERLRRRSAPAWRRCGPGVNGTATSWPAVLAACSTAAAPAEHDQVGQRDLSCPRSGSR